MSKEIVIEQEQPKEKKIKVLGGIIALAILGGISWMALDYFNKNYMYNGLIASNIFVENIEVSNMSKEEAISAVASKYTPQNINLEYEGKSYIILPTDIELEYNVDEVVENAYDYTKTESYIENVKRMFNLRNSKQEFDISASYNKDKLNSSIEDISSKINKEVSNAKVSISSSGNINVVPAVIGKTVDIEASTKSILDMIQSKSNEKLNLVVNIKDPKISTVQAQSVNTLLAEHTTRYTLSPEGRATNIALSARSTSDILLMPGEEFSYNNLTGPRSKANGYKDAGVIVNGKIEQGTGGGVCQTSTTLYNAVLFSGLKITDTQNHSIASSYAPIGQDAMVTDGYSDLKFVNPYNHPIYIKNIIGNGTVTSRVYGNASDMKNITIKVDQFTQGELPAAKTYRQYRNSNGEIIKTEFVATSVYKKLK